jgi:hypothetical protein
MYGIKIKQQMIKTNKTKPSKHEMYGTKIKQQIIKTNQSITSKTKPS